MKITSIAANEWHELQGSEDEMAISNLDEFSKALLEVLPSEQDLSQLFVRTVKALRPGDHVEFVPAKRLWRRLWLESDLNGPGYARQKLYAKLVVDSEALYILANKGSLFEKMIASLRAETQRLVGDVAQLLSARISTFRSFNALNGNQELTVRWFGSPLRYLNSHSTGIGLRQDFATDTLSAPIGSYFVICPPGEEYVQPDNER